MTNRWLTLPLRVRLVTLGVVGMLIGFAIGGATLVWALHASLQRSVDSVATKTAQEFAQLLVEDKLPEPITTGRDATIVQIFDADGRFERGSLGADPLVPLLRDWQLERAVHGEHFTVDGGRASMHGTLRATAERAGDRTVVVAVSQSELEAVPKLAFGLTITLGILVMAVAVLLWQMVGWTLRPVEAARSKQRAFVADAAHELRSPLANLRTELEVAQRIGPPEGLIADLLTDVERLSRMTEDLLLLSRMDDARRPWRPEEVDVTEFLNTVVDDYPDARVPVRWRPGEQPVTLRADHDALHRIFTNLIDNAVRYAATKVEVECAALDGELLLTVADDGPGIPVADRKRVFDRFTRLDDARGRDSGGTGLGLPIVAELVAMHRGTITLRAHQPHGLRAEVRLPLPGR
jgi:signal transduction histidine kinase